MKSFSQACHNCGGQIEEISEYQKLSRVTSDARPWCSGGHLMICQLCKLAQAAIDARWKTECDKIYGKYRIYRQAGGAEQAVFVGNDSVPRSRKLVRWLLKTVELPKRGRILDYGCGNGAFLREFQILNPKWELYGTEYDARNLKELKKIPNFRKLYLAGDKLPDDNFDFISMVHVLEHLPGPSKVLASLKQKMTHKSFLFLQVPDAKKNPLITVVADHASHFTEQTLKAVCFRSGLFDQKKHNKQPVPRELTFLGKFKKPKKPSNNDKCISFWKCFIKKLLVFAALGRRFSEQKKPVVFGSSIGAAWFFGVCKGRVQCFIDEDNSKVGKKHLSRPILGFSDYCKKNLSHHIWIPSMDKALSQKIKKTGYRIHSPC